MKFSSVSFVGAWMAALVLTACGQSDPAQTIPSITPVPVVVWQVGAVSKPTALALTGQVESAQTAQLSTRLMGTIQHIWVKEGQFVKAGQPLFEVNALDLVAKQGQLKTQLTQAEWAEKITRKDLDRYGILLQQKSVTTKEFEQINLQHVSALAQVNALKEAMKELQVQMGYSVVKAPFAGMVVKKMAEEGSLSSPGMPVLALEGNGQLQVSAVVPESLIQSVQVGQVVQVVAGEEAQAITAKIATVIGSTQFSGGQYLAKIALDPAAQKTLYAGMFTRVMLKPSTNTQKPTSTTLSVPSTAMVHQGQLTGLYVVVRDSAFLRWVKTGRQQDQETEILTGLRAGETIVSQPSLGLYNGIPVRIQNK